MPLVSKTFTGSWVIAGMTSCRTSDYSVKMNRGLLPFTCLIRERQFRQNEHVARLPDVDLAHRVVFV